MKPILEICCNLEAIREFCGFDFSSVAEGYGDEAAADLRDEIIHRLEAAGWRTEWAQGQRSLCHGWNGAHYASRIGSAGCFEPLSSAHEAEVFMLQEAAAAAVLPRWSEAATC